MSTDLSLANLNPAISSVPPDTENLKSPQADKKPCNSNSLNMFNNNTYTNFKTAYKHMLILRWCHPQELFGSQIPVTTGRFKLQTSWHEVII